MKKTFISILVVGLLLIVIPSYAMAFSQVPILKVDGRTIHTPSGEPAPYFNKDGRTMVSIRSIGQLIGVESSKIIWNSAAQTATIMKDDTTVQITVGNHIMLVNNKKVVMDTQAEAVQGRVFIPARFVGEALGIKFNYNANTKTVSFFTGGEIIHYYDAKLRGIQLGDTVAALESTLGKPDRQYTQDQLTYYTYNADYSEYALYMIQDNEVVTMYSNSQNVWDSKSLTPIGEPLPKTSDYSDIYIEYFIDNHASNTVEGIMLAVNWNSVPVLKSENTVKDDEEVALQIFDMTNAFRVKQKLTPLQWHEKLATIAYNHSKDMYVSNYFSHTNLEGLSPFDRMEQGGIRYSQAAENIAFGYINSADVVNGWINSFGHRQNMLEDVEHLGVGVHKYYYTQKFITEY